MGVFISCQERGTAALLAPVWESVVGVGVGVGDNGLAEGIGTVVIDHLPHDSASFPTRNSVDRFLKVVKGGADCRHVRCLFLGE